MVLIRAQILLLVFVFTMLFPSSSQAITLHVTSTAGGETNGTSSLQWQNLQLTYDGSNLGYSFDAKVYISDCPGCICQTLLWVDGTSARTCLRSGGRQTAFTHFEGSIPLTASDLSASTHNIRLIFALCYTCDDALAGGCHAVSGIVGTITAVTSADYVIDFELENNQAFTSYAAHTNILNGISWSTIGTYTGSETNEVINGVRSGRMREDGCMTMLSDLDNGLKHISFNYRRFHADTQVDWKVEYSLNQGDSWTQIGSSFISESNDTIQTFSRSVNIDQPIRVRITRATDPGTVIMNRYRMNIDDIVMSGYGNGGITNISLNDGLLAWWPFDGNANDASGNGRNATLFNTAHYVAGVSGQAAYLTGRGHTGTNGDHILFPFIGMSNQPAFTVSLWVKHDGYAGLYDHGENYISFRKPCGNTIYIAFWGTPWNFFYGTANRNVQIPSDGSEWGNWVLHTLVYSNGTIFAYKNGIYGGATNGAMVEAESEGGLGIHWFCSGGTVSTRFIGGIDDVRIYSRALSADEVSQLYQNGEGAFSGINIQSVGQRSDGSGKVDIDFNLTVPFGSTASVTLGLSTNGGVSWSVTPQGGSLSGDFGSGVSSGSRSISWNATAQLPSSTFNNNFRARLVATAAGETNISISAPFTVDLRGLQGGLTVAGKVRDASTSLGLAGVSINLAGQNTTSALNGNYSLANVVLTSGTTLTVSKLGYAALTQSVIVPAGANLVTVPDICLQAITAGNTNKPVVTKIEPRLKGIFLHGTTMNNDFTASVNWNGVTPGYVRFYANDVQIVDKTGVGPEYKCQINMGGGAFHPALNPFANKIRVNAVGSDGTSSEPLINYVTIVPIPDPIKALTLQSWPFTPYITGQIGVDFDLPNPPIKAVLSLPVIGKFGFEVAANASFDYTVTDGDWEVALGVGAEGTQGKRGRRPTIPGLTRYPKMKLYVGNKEISGKIEAGARGTATIDRGITFDEIFGHGELEAKLELGRVGLLDLLGPGLSSGVGAIPGLGDLTKTISIIIYVIPGVDGEIVFALQPVFAFDSLEISGKVGLEASYEPNLGFAEMRLYVGGEPSITFQVPGDLFKNVRFKAYAGAEFTWWVITIGPVEYVFVDVTYPDQRTKRLALPVSGAHGFLALPGSHINEVSPISRTYLEHGGEVFLATQSAAQRSILANSNDMSSLDAFRIIGQTPARGSVQEKMLKASGMPHSSDAKNTDDGDISGFVSQANVQMISNVFPYSQPTLAGVSSNLMLLYAGDNGNSNALQCTDIRWTIFDGWNWSAPTSIVADTHAEFNPHVVIDGNSNAVCVWERVADPDFTNVNISAMAAQMEIVYAMWNHATGQWTTPVALTSNSCLDHMPYLAGPLTNGDVMLVWTRNAANLIVGTGTNGAPENDVVLYSRWRVTSNSWSAPQVIVSNLSSRLSQSFAGIGNQAVYAWTTDADGVLTNDLDQEVYAKVWSNGTWFVGQQCTSNNVADKTVRAAVSPQGDIHLVWQSEGNLVSSLNFSNNIQLVREDSATAGFADYVMTYGPSGNMVLLWQEMCEDGSDMHYSVYDPVSDSWSKDARFFKDSILKRSFAPIWDNVGNLTIAYNAVEVFKTNKLVELEGGGSVVVSNVPQPGAVGISVMKRSFISDVAILPGDFTIEGANYLPGDALTLSAFLRNIGDVAVSNATIAFYEGNPSAGGTLITNVAWPGWLEGAATNAVLSTVWVVPEPATNRTLYTVANPGHSFTEFTENNNTQAVNIGGADLSASLISATAETNGSARVIAQVQNLGAPGVTNTILAIRRQGQTGAPLATVEVPALDPGRLAQVALDLPDGAQPEGEAFYSLKADDTEVVFDIDTNNNTTTFALNLWLDRDGDGIPDWWETEYFGGPTNAVASAMASNGVNTLLQAYIAGLDPNDPHSYLIVESVAAIGNDPSTGGGFRITWGSVSNRFYRISRAETLVDGQGFAPLAQHIQADPPVNTYLDATATTNWGPAFYRIEVE